MTQQYRAETPEMTTPEHQPQTPADESPSRLALAPRLSIPRALLRFSFVRASGPGGQNVNKRSTAAELRVNLLDLPLSDPARARLARHAPTIGAIVTDAGELIINADESRSQRQNREACVERLRELVARALVEPRKRIKTKPTKGSRKRRLETKARRSGVKSLRRKPRPNDD